MRKTYPLTFIRPARALVLVGALVCCAPAYAGQSGRRVLSQAPVEPGRQSPVEVVSVRVKGEAVEPGRSFVAGDDWLHGLTFRVKNVSDKPLMFVGLSLLFPTAADKGKSVQLSGPLGYGCWPGFPCRPDAGGSYKEIMPGEVREIELMTARYEGFMAALARVGAALPVESAEYDIDTVFIDADTMWSRGLLFRRDTVKPDGFKMVGKYVLPERP
jgi:hypothetical protein